MSNWWEREPPGKVLPEQREFAERVLHGPDYWTPGTVGGPFEEPTAPTAPEPRFAPPTALQGGPVTEQMPAEALQVEDPWWEPEPAPVGSRPMEDYALSGARAFERIGLGRGWQSVYEADWAPPWLRGLGEMTEIGFARAGERLEAGLAKPEERVEAGPIEKKTWGEALTEEREKFAKFGKVGAWIPALWSAEAGQLGRKWDELTREHALPRMLEKLGGSVIWALQEGDIAAEVGLTALGMSEDPRLREMEVAEWYPLTEKGWSFARHEIQSWGRQLGASLGFEGQPPSPIAEGVLPIGLREALTRVRAGEKAWDVAVEQDDLAAELVGQMIVSPWNIIDVIQIMRAPAKVKHADEAVRLMAEVAENDPRAMRILEAMKAGIDQVTDLEAQYLDEAMTAAGSKATPVLKRRLRDRLNPFAHTPSAKVNRDISEMWIAYGGPITDAEDGLEAAALIRKMIDDPASLVPYYGKSMDSLAARKAQQLLRDLGEKIADLPAVKAEIWNPAHFIVDLEHLAMGRAKALHGWKEPGPYMRFANAWKGLMSEFYLTALLAPGYTVRNTLTDLFTMATDGLTNFSRMEDIDNYLNALGGMTTRRVTTEGRGARELLTGIVEGESRLPGPLGWISKKGQEFTRHADIAGRFPMGEEPRYKRSFARALKDFLGGNATTRQPAVPLDVVAFYGDDVNDLVRNVGNALNRKDKAAIVERFLKQKSMSDVVDLTKYIPEDLLDGVDTGMLGRLRKQLQDLGADPTPEAVDGVFDDLVEMIDSGEMERLKDHVPPPVRKEASDVTEAEITDRTVDELKDIAKKAEDPDLERAIDAEVKPRLEAADDEARAARDAAVQAADAMDNDDAFEVMYWAWREANKSRAKHYQEIDKIMRETVDLWRKGEAGPEEWVKYFKAKADNSIAMKEARGGIFAKAQEHLQGLADGKTLESLIGQSRRGLAEERLIAASVMKADGPVGYLPGPLRDAQDAKFAEYVGAMRTRIGVPEAQTWRAARTIENRDLGAMLDLISSADDDVFFYGQQAAHSVREANERIYKKAVAAARKQKGRAAGRQAFDQVYQEYYVIRDDAWRKYEQAAIDRWRITERDVLTHEYMSSRPKQAPPFPVEKAKPKREWAPDEVEEVTKALWEPEGQRSDEGKALISEWLDDGSPGAEQMRLPEVIPQPDPYTRGMFARDLQDVFGLDDAKRDAVLAITDARANVWGKHLGRDPAEWYPSRLGGMETGTAPDLYQWKPTGRAQPITENALRIFGEAPTDEGAGWLLGDGRIVDMGGRPGEPRKWIHGDVALAFPEHSQLSISEWRGVPTNAQANVLQMVRDTGGIRYSSSPTGKFVELGTPPTRKQRQFLNMWVEDPKLQVLVDVTDPVTGNIQWSGEVYTRGQLGKAINELPADVLYQASNFRQADFLHILQLSTEEGIALRMDNAAEVLTRHLGDDWNDETRALVEAGQFWDPAVSERFGVWQKEKTWEQIEAYSAAIDYRGAWTDANADELRRAVSPLSKEEGTRLDALKARIEQGAEAEQPSRFMPTPDEWQEYDELAARAAEHGRSIEYPIQRRARKGIMRSQDEERRWTELSTGRLTGDARPAAPGEFERLQSLQPYVRDPGVLYQAPQPPPRTPSVVEWAPRWYHKADVIIDAKMPNRASVEQVKALLTKGGVREEELRWSRILDWLDTQEGMITKDEVATFLRENQVTVEEVVRGGEADVRRTLTRAENVARTQMDETQGRVLGAIMETTGYDRNRAYQELSFIRDNVQSQVRIDPALAEEYRTAIRSFDEVTAQLGEVLMEGAPKYQQYRAVKGPAEKYRELSFRLPDEALPYWEWEARRGVSPSLPAARPEYEELVRGGDAPRRWSPEFVDTAHGARNELGWARFEERVDARGRKGLMVQEIQSQWAQKGRAEGFAPRRRPVRAEALPDGWTVRFEEGAPDWPPAARNGWEIRDEQGELIRRVGQELADTEEGAVWRYLEDDYQGQLETITGLQTTRRPPEMPFAKNYDELILKRLLRWAAEQDYDWIALTRAQEQVELWSSELRRVVDEVEWTHLSHEMLNEAGERTGWLQADSPLIGRADIPQRPLDEPLYNVVLRKEGQHVGPGMDEISRKMGQHWTADELRENLGPANAERIMASPTGKIADEEIIVGGKGFIAKYDRQFKNRLNELGKRWGGRLEEVDLPAGPPAFRAEAQEIRRVRMMDLSPKMKDDLLREGLPLFQAEQAIPKGGFRLNRDGKAILIAFEEKDISSVVHEIAHVFRRFDLDPQDLAIVEKWADVKRGHWAAENEELFARAFERYLADGNLPTGAPEGLQAVFEKFKEWLLEIYHSIAGSELDVDLSPDVKRVFDRLLIEEPPFRTALPDRRLGRKVRGWVDPATKYDFQYRVVDLDDLAASHTQTLAKNRHFPDELQPRDRERKAYMEQIEDIAQKLDPEEVISTTTNLDAGPLIVGPDGVIESGNGRFLGIERASLQVEDRYADYVKYLRENINQFGLSAEDIDAVQRPVLVRERLTDTDRVAFSLEAQEGKTYRMAASEVGAADVDRIPDNVLSMLEVGETQSIDQALRSSRNQVVVNKFLDKLPKKQAAELRDAGGRINKVGLQRIKAALFAKTYPGAAGRRLLQSIFESSDTAIKNVETALFASLHDMSRAEAAIKAGARDARLSITGDVSQVADVLARLKEEGPTVAEYLVQTMIGGPELNPMQMDLLRYMEDNKRSAKKIGDLLREYARLVLEQAPAEQAGLMGADVGRVDPHHLLNGAYKKVIGITPEPYFRPKGTDALFQFSMWEHAWVNDARAAWGLTTKTEEGGFLLSGGGMLDLSGEYAGARTFAHEAVSGVSPAGNVEDFLRTTGAARMSDYGPIFLEFWRDPSPAQMKFMDEQLKAGKKLLVFVFDHGGTEKFGDWLEHPGALYMFKQMLNPEEGLTVTMAKQGNMSIEEARRGAAYVQQTLFQKAKKAAEEVPPEQLPMFEAGEELPLFSETAVRAQQPKFAPPPAVKQLGIPGLEVRPEDVIAADRAKRLRGKKPKAPPPGQAELFQQADPTTTERFRNWFGESEVKDSLGHPEVVYHGTMREFSAFDVGRSNPESFFGAGFYFTDSPDDVAMNYARLQGPDPNGKLERVMDEIRDIETLEELEARFGDLQGIDFSGGDDVIEQQVRELATRQLGDHEGAVVPAYVKMENPLYLASAEAYPSTRFNQDLQMDWDAIDWDGLDVDAATRARVEGGEISPWDIEGLEDEIQWSNAERGVMTDETGREMDLYKAIEDACWEHGLQPGDVYGPLMDELGDDFYNLKANHLREAMGKIPLVQHLDGEWGGAYRLLADQFIQDVFRNLGYDGVIMHADDFFPRMPDVTDATHYIVFEAENAKSVFAANFDPNDPAMLHQEFSRGQYNSLLEQKGAAEPPTPAPMVQTEANTTREALEHVRRGVKRDFPKWQQQQTSQAVQKSTWDWFNKEVMPEWFDTRAVALQYAKNQADRALLNYRDYRNFDLGISYIAPYHFWYSRTAWNWAQRLPSRPGILAAYVRSRAAMQKANQEAGRRQRFEAKLKLPAPWLPDWMGDSLYVDPARSVVPFANLGGTNWDDPDESKAGLRRVWDVIQGAGLRPFHYLELPYQAGWLAKAGEAVGMDPEVARKTLAPEFPNFSMVLPQLSLLRNVTAGAPWAPPAGVNVEAPFRRAAGLPAGETWEPYQVGRMLGNLAAEHKADPDRARATLDAKELMDRDVNQDANVWSPDSSMAIEVAGELNWEPDRLAAAQSMLSLAMTRASKERLVKSVGWLMGPSMSIEPAGERAQMEMAEEARGTIWREDQPEGSYQAYRAFKQAHPAMYTRAVQYKMPGDEEYTGMGPGARANWMLYSEEKDRINDEYNAAIDGFLRKRPWDLSGAYKGSHERRAAATDEARLRYPLPEMGEVPNILYGMNPEEMWDSTVEDTLYDLQASEPQADDFAAAGGEINWDAYNSAQATWRASLPALGEIQGGTYAGMDPQTAYKTFEQRFHTPVQAMAYTYRDNIKNPAWELYRRLKDRGTSGGAAYEQSVARVGPMPATALIPAILRGYQGKQWTPEELQRELRGINFPALGEQKTDTATSEGVGTATTAGTVGGGGGGYTFRPGRPWWAQPRRGGGGGGGRAKRAGLAQKSKAGYYPRWRPPPSIRGGPFQKSFYQ